MQNKIKIAESKNRTRSTNKNSKISDEDKYFSEWINEKLTKINESIRSNLFIFTSHGYLANDNLGAGYYHDNKDIKLGVHEPAMYLLQLKSKRIRSLLTLLIIEAFGSDSNNYIEFAVVPEIIHNGTLIHDDIEDGSKMRRGNKAVHVKYGLAKSLNLGSIMYFLPLNIIFDSNKMDIETKYKILKFCIKDLVTLGIGQSVDIVWHNNEVDMSSIAEDQVMQVLADKTGALMSMALKIGAVIGGADDNTVEKIGVRMRRH